MNELIEKVSKALSETGKAVSEKTKAVGESAKLNGRILSCDNTVRNSYYTLGEYYYKKCKDNPDEEIAETVKEITAALDSIEEMKAQLLSLKGAVKCAECGAECPIDSSFCGKCGAKLVKPEPPAEEKPAEEKSAEEPSEVLHGEVIENDETEK